ncbi:HK97 gp10 family phage protein [Streptomyces sp. MI02-7b]|uniref:HK97 gp10 family phage protein n=1 Tax=Streptomyces sp. MI02-7b TaxID=462941 RepID=UPI0029B8638D|nr:HK97 gp10 family phage protein [Streptomyces sp. MI02-7b]MDX3074619.1 HK97 gp10 family phage protein [Streptomyces sp. MI02-7b]
MARIFDASAQTTINTRQFERGLRRVLGRMSDDVRRALVQTGVDVQNRARELCPVDTGRLRASIVHRVEGGGRSVGVVIGTNVSYAADVEYGTKPHVILPKNKKALYWPGAAHPVSKVNHPGTRPRPFMRPAVELAPIFFSRNIDRIRAGRGQ